jgi:hypothetical protein
MSFPAPRVEAPGGREASRRLGEPRPPGTVPCFDAPAAGRIQGTPPVVLRQPPRGAFPNRSPEDDDLASQPTRSRFEDEEPIMDLPRDQKYPAGAGQCDGCGGHGCAACGGKGWLPAGHPSVRRCEHCGAALPRAHVAVYCSNACALADG